MKARNASCIIWIAAQIALCAGAFGQETAFPTRTVSIVVPYSPGTTPDILARLLGPRLAERWKVGAITDNRPGATGTIGMAHVAKAAPDGHTLMFVPSSFAMVPALYPKLAFDPARSFEPVTLLATGALGLVVHPQLPARSLRELVQLAKRNPGLLYYASPGNGSAQHLAMELFKLETGINAVHVPHKGFAGALTDVVGGHVQTMIAPLQTVQPFVASGKLRMLAVMSSQRVPTFADVPTAAEQGLAQVDIQLWSGALAPVGTPASVIARIHAELAALLSQSDVREQIEKQGMRAMAEPSQRFAAVIKSDLARWSKVVAAAKIKLE